jgi:hypothetical protein
MAHWAELDEANKVIRVLVGDNNDPAGDEGYQWLIDNLGGTWVKTSYNATTNGFRKNYAGIGYSYDPIDDAFIAPMPECGHDELLLNDLKRWECVTCEANLEQSRTTA